MKRPWRRLRLNPVSASQTYRNPAADAISLPVFFRGRNSEAAPRVRDEKITTDVKPLPKVLT